MEEHRVHNEEENEVRGFGMDFFAVEGLQQHGEAYLEQQRHPGERRVPASTSSEGATGAAAASTGGSGGGGEHETDVSHRFFDTSLNRILALRDAKLTSEPTRGRSESLKALVNNVALILTSLRAGDTAHAVNEGPFIVPETLKVSIHHLVFKAKKSSSENLAESLQNLAEPWLPRRSSHSQMTLAAPSSATSPSPYASPIAPTSSPPIAPTSSPPHNSGTASPSPSSRHGRGQSSSANDLGNPWQLEVLRELYELSIHPEYKTTWLGRGLPRFQDSMNTCHRRQDAQIYTKTRGLLGALTSEFRQDKSIEDLKDTVRVYMLQINCAQVLYELAYLLVVDGNSLVLKQFTQFCAAVLFEQYNKACVDPLKAIIEYGGKRNAPEGFRAADSGRPGKRSRLRVTTSDSMDSVLS